jgi:HlyD family secretion protein
MEIPMKKTTFYIALAAAAVAVLAAAFGLNRSASASAMPATRSIAPAESAAAAPHTVKAIGNLMSANQVTLAFQAAGRIQEIDVKAGDRVPRGARLAALDTRPFELQIAQAQAALDAATATYTKVKAGPTQDDILIAKSNLDRAKAALDQAQTAYDRIGGDSNPFSGLAPQALALQQAYSAYQAAQASYNLAVNHPTATELQVAQAQVAQAQAALDLAKQNLTNAQIVAPFDGTVLWITPKVGETASPGAPAITLADLTRMQAQVGIDEDTLPLIQVGQTATITLDALPGKTLTGKVSQIGILATNTAGIVTLPVTIDIDPTDALIYPGLSATVEINAAN